MKREQKNQVINDILFHLGEQRDDYYGAVAPPVIQSSNFVFDSVAQMRTSISDEMHHHIYTRGNNPTTEILRQKLAALEHAEDALVTSSGSAAISIALLTFLQSGDHIICIEKPYSWTFKMITNVLARFGVEYTFVDATDVENTRKAIRPNTKVIYLESPNSLTFELQDLAAHARLAKEHGIITMVDNSHCSPIFQNPIDFGIDLVLHSGTKYINGHSDVVLGVICGSKALIKEIFTGAFMTFGVNMSPHDASLVIRGLRTLPLRVTRSDESSKKVYQWLKTHPKVKQVIYTMSEDFPQRDLAKRQMRGNGGLISAYFKCDDKSKMEHFIDSLKKFLLAVSWGGYESLVIPTIVFHDMEGVPDSPIPWTFVRFYVGLEDPDYLIEDLSQALALL